jgi:hypothetical protein
MIESQKHDEATAKIRQAAERDGVTPAEIARLNAATVPAEKPTKAKDEIAK